ncbi:unnamed protein product [Dicrocoelium dendriticum]|nr:unnamed protein product [Dicrocoelium dendriticum]
MMKTSPSGCCGNDTYRADNALIYALVNPQLHAASSKYGCRLMQCYVSWTVYLTKLRGLLLRHKKLANSAPRHPKDRDQCPAWGRIYANRGRRRHFARCCQSPKVNALNCDTKPSDSGHSM